MNPGDRVTYVTDRTADGLRSHFRVGTYLGKDRRGRLRVEHGGTIAPAWVERCRPDQVVKVVPA